MAVCAPSGERGSVFSKGLASMLGVIFRDKSTTAHMETPPWLCRCELCVQAGIKELAPLLSLSSPLSLVPQPLCTAWISQSSVQAGGEGRCLMPKPPTAGLGCAVPPGRAKTRGQSVQVPRQGHFCAFLHNLGRTGPRVPACGCCGGKAEPFFS